MNKENKKKNNKKENDLIESEVDDISFEESDEDGFILPKKDRLKKTINDLKKCRKEKEEYLTGWQRSKADYVNLQKELDKIRIDSSNKEKEDILINLLPVLDSFEMAFSNKKSWEKVDKEWRVGIEYIYQQFISSLNKSNFYKIDETNILFNPEIHNSIKIIETKEKEKDHMVAKVIQAGYKIGGLTDTSTFNNVIRPATVNIYEYKK